MWEAVGPAARDAPTENQRPCSEIIREGIEWCLRNRSDRKSLHVPVPRRESGQGVLPVCADHPPQVFAGCLLSSGVHVAGSRHIRGASAPGLSQAAYTVQMENGGVNPPGLDSCMTARGMPPPHRPSSSQFTPSEPQLPLLEDGHV